MKSKQQKIQAKKSISKIEKYVVFNTHILIEPILSNILKIPKNAVKSKGNLHKKYSNGNDKKSC